MSDPGIDDQPPAPGRLSGGSADDEAALSAFYYYVITSTIPTAVIEAGPVLVLHNPACSVLLGYEPSELAGLDTELLEPEHAELFAVAIARALASDDASETVDLTLIHKDGRRVPARVSVTRTTVAARTFALAVAVPIEAP